MAAPVGAFMEFSGCVMLTVPVSLHIEFELLQKGDDYLHRNSTNIYLVGGGIWSAAD